MIRTKYCECFRFKKKYVFKKVTLLNSALFKSRGTCSNCDKASSYKIHKESHNRSRNKNLEDNHCHLKL